MTRLAPLALAALVALLPLVPAEHVHESDHDGRHEATAHRHFAVHFEGGSTRHDDDHRQWADHDDDHVIDVGAVYASHPVFTLVAPGAIVVALLPAPPMVVAAGMAPDVERLIHGPPRAPTGLRAPPVSPRL